MAGAKTRAVGVDGTGCGASDTETVDDSDMEPMSGSSCVASWTAVVGERPAVG